MIKYDFVPIIIRMAHIKMINKKYVFTIFFIEFRFKVCSYKPIKLAAKYHVRLKIKTIEKYL
ncbi:hypothetical protein MuYL_4818 [Mucilaginibacter xinganensis]|uniref:Uncharacterized protein n=1 Tax=Mucilaginibacter xinganensis TaxID=1234841 RepID=A0A223P4H9_9SPHI|nr:hypothetical protein MuYL_4818 [Mucilaginibacter xinganensis]